MDLIAGQAVGPVEIHNPFPGFLLQPSQSFELGLARGNLKEETLDQCGHRCIALRRHHARPPIGFIIE